MAKRIRVGWATFLVLAGLIVVAPAAHADGGIYGADGSLYDGCHDYAVAYNVSYPGASSWEIDGSAYSPSGDYSSGFYEYGDGASASRTDSVYLCEYEGAGNWDLEAVVSYYDDEYNVMYTETLYGNMHMSKMRTRTRLRVSDRTPRFNSVVRFTVTSQQDKWVGWRANNYDHVALYARCRGGDWYRVRGSKSTTDQYGRAVLRYRWNVHGRCRTKAYTLSSSDAGASWSPIRRMRSTGKALSARLTASPDLW